MTRLVTVAALALSTLAVSACGTGLQAQTYKSRTPYGSTSATVGDIAIRNLAVQPPADGETLAKGGRATVSGSFVNEGTEADALVDASSDVASSVVLQSGGADATVAIPPLGSSSTSWTVVLDGLTRDLQPGRFITVTLDFQRAGRTTVQVPVKTGDNGLADRKSEQNPYGEGESGPDGFRP